MLGPSGAPVLAAGVSHALEPLVDRPTYCSAPETGLACRPRVIRSGFVMVCVRAILLVLLWHRRLYGHRRRAAITN